jgi:N-acetylglucosamine-6-sulfatase
VWTSRASILTGQYSSRHRVIDNNRMVPPGTVFYPEFLQEAGYQTAFIGNLNVNGESVPVGGRRTFG